MMWRCCFNEAGAFAPEILASAVLNCCMAGRFNEAGAFAPEIFCGGGRRNPAPMSFNEAGAFAPEISRPCPPSATSWWTLQ